MGKGIVHRGMDYQRVVVNKQLNHGKLEVAFAEAWEEENRERPGINYGHGILQDLMYRPAATALGAPVCRRQITQADAELVATAIQWLGTNVGFAFLDDVLRTAGYKIVNDDHGKGIRDREIDVRNREIALEQQAKAIREAGTKDTEIARLKAMEDAARTMREHLERALAKPAPEKQLTPAAALTDPRT